MAIGTVVNSPASLVIPIGGGAGDTILVNGANTQDDYAFGVTKIDFPFPLFGTNFTASQVFPSSNSFIAFGASSTVWDNFTHSSPPVSKILVASADYISNYLSEKLTSPGKAWVLHYEGNARNPGLKTICEITLFSDGVIQLVTAAAPNWNAMASPVSMIANASGTSFFDYATPAAGQSYVFVPNGSTYTMSTGAKYDITAPPTGGTTFTKSLSDSVTASDIIRKLASTRESDSVTASDALAKKTVKAASDIITASDSLSKRLAVTVVETVPTSDMPRKTSAKSVVDGVSAADNPVTLNRGKAVNLADSVAIVDAIRKSVARIQADGITATETETEASVKRLLDVLTVSDSMAATGGKTVILSDSVGITDSIGKAALVTKMDALGLADSFTRQSAVSVRLYDVILTTDIMQTHIPNAPTIIGTIPLSGERTLYVYLNASRILDITLDGSEEVNATLRGDIE